MPEPLTPSAAGAAPQGQPQAAPMGASPATGPTPNKGYEAAGLQKVAMATKLLTEALPLLGAGSEAGQALLKAIGPLSKLAPPGTVTPAAEKNTLEQALMKSVQNAGQMRQMQQGAAGGAGGAGGMPGAGGGGMPPGMPGGARAA